MRRRPLLAALGTAAVAGCLSNAPLGGDDGRTPIEPPDDWGECPSFEDDVDLTVCATDAAGADVALTPSSRTFEEDGDDEVETLTFTLRNDGDGPFRFNPHDWAVMRWIPDGWERVAPDEHVDPLYELPAGGTYEWVLSTTEHPSPMSEDSTAVVVDLTAGERYAFRVDGWFGEFDGGRRIETVARFEYRRAGGE